MIEPRCLGPGVDRSKIAPDAEITGASLLTGPRTVVGAGAVVRNARVHNGVIAPGARVEDSIVQAEGRPRQHKCDAAGRVIVSGVKTPEIGARAVVRGATLINTAVGEGARVTDCWAHDCRFGPHNALSQAKFVLTETGERVAVRGPTEVTEAWLGHHATIDERGYFEGIFSNVFRRVERDAASGRLRVVDAIDLPHVSRYGVNTINSTNSGKLLPQPGGVARSFGRQGGLWHIGLLSHEQIELGPCCWVLPWTKVIGQSGAPHETDDDLVNDALTTYVMPFAMAGLDGAATQGLVMPGEMSVGFGPKQRKGAWVFTYTPGAVMAMVRRLREALEPDRRHLADTIVIEALRVAMVITEAMAAQRGVDLSLPCARQRRGWPRWIATTHALLRAHLHGNLWEFEAGEPRGWRMEAGRWTHPAMDRVLAIAPDALEIQRSEESLFVAEDPVPRARVAVPAGALPGTCGEPRIHPGARVAADATIGPGCRIGDGTIVASGAVLWNSVVEQCRIGQGAQVERSEVCGGAIGDRAVVRSCRMQDTRLGRDSHADAAAMRHADLAPLTTVSAFADLDDVRCAFGAILGGAFHCAEIGTHLMSMHMAGACRHLRAMPMVVDLDGERLAVPAIPMLGGGSLIRGTAEQPVEMACCFIGSNAVLEPDTRVGFGSFVLGRLGPHAGIPPFTLSTGPESRRHEIGAVLTAMPSTVMSHFIDWTFHALGPESAPWVARMVTAAIAEGIAAVRRELARRSGDDRPAGTPPELYRSLREYEDAHLRRGLDLYRQALDSGAWDLEYADGELRFASRKGRWLVRNGAAVWQPNPA